MGRIPLLAAAMVGAQLALACAAQAQADVTGPSSRAEPPASANRATFDIPYTATDDGGFRIVTVELWVKRPSAAAYTYSQTDATPETPTFSYTADAGDGSYSFYTVATATDGTELPPGGADGSTLVDTTPPASQASAPASSNGSPITISYSTSDAGSGVQSVELWVKRPGSSGFNVADTDTSPDSPSFLYGPAAGDGSYAFYTVAVDRLGNREPAPAGADTTTLVKSAPATTSTTTSLPAAQAPALQQPKALVAAVSLVKGQKLGSVLRNGLSLELYAYRDVSLKLELSVARRVAQALGLRDPRVAVHSWQVITPKIYRLKLRLKPAAVRLLRKLQRVRFELRSVLSAPGGKSIASNTLTFSRR